MSGRKVVIISVKVIIGGRLRIIPGDVLIVEAVRESHDIPGVILPRISCTVIARDTKLLQDILICPCVSGADGPPIYQCAVRTLSQSRSRIICNMIYQIIVYIFLFRIIVRKAAGSRNNRVCRFIEILFCTVQGIGYGIVCQLYLHHGAGFGILYRIACIQIKELGMVVHHGLKYL